MKHYDETVARRALALWPDTRDDLAHLGTSGNAVYRVVAGGASAVLRLTHDAWRAPAQNEAECAFLAHAARVGARVHAPIASRSGLLVEKVDDATASVFTWAHGDLIGPGDPRRTEPFFREWGRALAELHHAAETYDGPPRFDWRDEGLIADAESILPATDHAVRAELAEARARIEALPATRANYGHTHADFGPQNFRLAPDGRITAIDFGNCCRHWYVMDLAISLSTLRRDPDRARWKDAIVRGYTGVRPLDPASWAELDAFLRLRIAYVYLSRLLWFGDDPTAEQRAVLATLRAAVLERFAWT